MKENVPCCDVQEVGVENMRRAPHASHDIVSSSTLTQPLLAQLTGPIT
jgi:hypothetical protein